MNRILRVFLGLVLCEVSLNPPAHAGDWPRFRGPNGAGISDERDYPTKWSATENIAWRTQLPGPGASSPIAVGQKVFLTCWRGYGVEAGSPGDRKDLERLLVCVNRADGKILWQKGVPGTSDEDQFRGFIQSHGYATATPTSDGERVYVFFGKAGVFAFDLDGNPLWQASVGSGSAQMGWGTGTSPILHKQFVIVPAFAEGKALVAFDKVTGKQAWKLPAPGFDGSWSTPILVDLPNGKQELVVSVPFEIWGVDPDNGDFLWYSEGIKENTICPSLVAKDGVVYAIGGRRGGSVAVRAGGRDEVTKTHVVWQKTFGSYVPSPVLLGEHLYWVSDQGIAYCVKAADGETVYRERVSGAGQLYASVVSANGKLYAPSREGGVFVFAAKPDFEQLAHNQLDDNAGTCNATPALSDGQVLLRTNRYLYCIGGK